MFLRMVAFLGSLSYAIYQVIFMGSLGNNDV